MPKIDSFLNAFTSIQGNPTALACLTMIIFMVMLPLILWLILKIIEAAKK